MSINLERNNVVHLDGYHWNKEKDEDKPLLSQLASDLLKNGFNDVGPEIIKLTISDDELTSFIDKFIVYHYDSDPTKVGSGAYGNAYEDVAYHPNGIPQIRQNDYNKLIYDLKMEDGGNPVGQRFKYIHQSYSDPKRWNERWREFPTKEMITSTAAYLGPNSELFSYLNPHPANMLTDSTSLSGVSGKRSHQNRVRKTVLNIGPDKYERVFNETTVRGEDGGVYTGPAENSEYHYTTADVGAGSLTGQSPTLGTPLAKGIYPGAARFTEVAQFRVGQRIVGEDSGAVGVVTAVLDKDGNPCVVGKNLFESNMRFSDDLLSNVRGQDAELISSGAAQFLFTQFGITDFDTKVDDVYAVYVDGVKIDSSSNIDWTVTNENISFTENENAHIVGSGSIVKISYGPRMTSNRLPQSGMIYGGNYSPDKDLPPESSDEFSLAQQRVTDNKPYGNLQRETIFIEEWCKQTEGRQLVIESITDDFFAGEKLFSESPWGDDVNNQGVPTHESGTPHELIKDQGDRGNPTGITGALNFSAESRFKSQVDLTGVVWSSPDSVRTPATVGNKSLEALSFRIEYERLKQFINPNPSSKLESETAGDSLARRHLLIDSGVVDGPAEDISNNQAFGTAWNSQNSSTAIQSATTIQYFPALVTGWKRSGSNRGNFTNADAQYGEQNEYDGFGASPAERMSYITLDVMNAEESSDFVEESGEGKLFLKQEPKGARAAASGFSEGYVGLNTVAQLVYENEFNKVKRCLINSARGVKFSPEDVTTGLASTTEASLVQYKEEELVQGNKHHFWIALDKSETFFTSDQIEPKALSGTMTLSLKSTDDSSPSPRSVTGLQLGDEYTFTFQRIKGRYTGTSDDILFGSPVIITLSVESENVSDFAERLMNSLNNNLPEYSFELDKENASNIIFRSNDVGMDLSLGYSKSDNSESLKPIRAISDRASSGMDPINAVSTPATANPNTGNLYEGQFGNSIKSTSDAIGNYYTQGYAHRIEFVLPNNAYYGDKFKFKLQGLISQSTTTEVYSTPSTFDLDLTFVADRKYNSVSQLGTAIKSSFAKNPYISKFMNVSLESNVIRFEYTTSSWAYLDKSSVYNLTSPYGLMNENSSKYASVYDDGQSDDPDKFSSVISAPAGFAEESFFALVKSMTSRDDLQEIPENVSLYEMRIYDTSQGSYIQNAIYEDDIPNIAKFSGTLEVEEMDFYTFDDDSLGGIGPLKSVGFVRNQSPSSLVRQKVKIKFPFARDFGTFADPITHLSDSVGAGYCVEDTISSDFSTVTKTDSYGNKLIGGNTRYFSSYRQHIIGASGPKQNSSDTDNVSDKGFIRQGARRGPEFSFDSDFRGYHPEVSVSDKNAHFSSFPYHECGLELESFEFIEDYSIGPIVLETNGDKSLGGIEGDQPWRIRLDVSRGSEVVDASPFIATQFYQGVGGQKPESDFEHLKVHVATSYQLRNDGTVTQIQGKDGLKPSDFREPGFLGGVRPQYAGYVRARTHLISPEVSNSSEVESLETLRRSGLNTKSGIVGYSDYPRTETVVEEDQRVLGGVESTRSEFRYEDRYLRGSSTELVFDTPYNTGSLRMQKGFFRRTGKQNRRIALTYPMSYTLTIADHGIFFYLRDQAAAAQADDYAWFVIQRHVDSNTGVPDYDSMSQPVHCVYQTSEPPLLYSDLTPFFTDTDKRDRTSSIMVDGLVTQFGTTTFDFRIDEFVEQELKAFDIESQGRFRRFIVREKDILKPWDRHVFAGISEIDSAAVLNTLEQLALNEDGQLVIQFPNRLGSQRYFFTGKELDLIAFSDGGAVGQDTLITSDRFSSPNTTDKRRLYKALMSTKPYGNGMRVMALVAGFGIEESEADTRLLSS